MRASLSRVLFLNLIFLIASCSSEKKAVSGDPCALRFNKSTKTSVFNEKNNIILKSISGAASAGGFAVDLILYSVTNPLPKVLLCVPIEVVTNLPGALLLGPLGGYYSGEEGKAAKKCYESVDIYSYDYSLGKKIDASLGAKKCDQAVELARPYIEYAQCHQKLGSLSSRRKARDSYQYLVNDPYFVDCLPYQEIKRFRSYKI